MIRICILLFITSLIGCKSIQVNNSAKSNVITKDAIINSNFLNRVVANNIHFKRSKFSLESNDLTQSLTGSYFINKDSFIIFSVQALLGIEVVRIKVSPTEVVILDRLKNQALFVSYNSFVSKYAKGITYSTLQSILLNSLFDLENYNKEVIAYDNYIEEFSDSLYTLKKQSTGLFSWLSSAKGSNFDQSFVFDISTGNLIQSNIIDNSLQSTLKVNYRSFKVEDSLKLPLQCDVLATISDKCYKLYIQSNSFIVNASPGINFSIPSSYEKIYK